MSDCLPDGVQAALKAAWTQRASLLAALIRAARGDFVAAEEALSQALEAATAVWPRDGVPDSPEGWLVSAGRLALLRQASRAAQSLETSDPDGKLWGGAVAPVEGEVVLDNLIDFGGDDDQLRLVFTCCHPALAPAARVALTLNAVCGLEAHAISRAFLVEEATLAQRLVRAKRKIRDAGIPFRAPTSAELGERLPEVLKTIELIFNEGYACTRGRDLISERLCDEAIQLASSLARLLPDETEPMGLLAMLFLTDARREARVSEGGDLVTLPEQDRRLWDQRKVVAGRSLLAQAVQLGGDGPLVLRAALAAEHSTAASAEDTRWARIVELYDALLVIEPSPVVALNRATAVGEASGPQAMLTAVEAIEDPGGALASSHYRLAVIGEAQRRMGRTLEARASFEAASQLAENDMERRHLLRRAEACF
ncbi:MAG: DUF6596 domain-containing protein [Planctomycetota bacterium]